MSVAQTNSTDERLLGYSGILLFPEVKVDLSLAAVYDEVVFECSAAEEMMLIPLEVFGRICDYRV